MHKLFKQFKNWDLTTMGYYSYLDFQNLEFVKKQFNNVSEKSDYSREYKKRHSDQYMFSEGSKGNLDKY